MVSAGFLGWWLAAHALALLLHGIGVDVVGELNVKTGERSDSAERLRNALVVAVLLVAIACTAKVVRRYRSSAVVMNHPTAVRAIT